MAADASRYHALFSGWDALVGDPLAGGSRILEVERGRLLVAVDHPGLMQLLLLRRRAILRALGRRFPQLGIRSLRTVVLPAHHDQGIEAPGTADQDQAASAVPLPEDVRRDLGALGDERLRANLAELYRQALKRDRGKPPEGSSGSSGARR